MIVFFVLARAELQLNLRPEGLSFAIKLLSRKDQTPIHLLISLEVGLQCIDQVFELGGSDGAAFLGRLPCGHSAVGVGGCGEHGRSRQIGALGREERQSNTHVGRRTTRDGLKDVTCDEWA